MPPRRLRSAQTGLRMSVGAVDLVIVSVGRRVSRGHAGRDGAGRWKERAKRGRRSLPRAAGGDQLTVLEEPVAHARRSNAELTGLTAEW